MKDNTISQISGIKKNSRGFYFAAKTIPMIICAELCKRYTKNQEWASKNDILDHLNNEKSKNVTKDSLNQSISKLLKSNLIMSDRGYYTVTDLGESILSESQKQMEEDLVNLTESLGSRSRFIDNANNANNANIAIA